MSKNKPSHAAAVKQKQCVPYPTDWLVTAEEKASLNQQTHEALSALAAYYEKSKP